MSIAGIDHINIVTDRLEETAAFYSHLLGLTREAIPPQVSKMGGAWMCDATGAAIVHLIAYDEARHGEPRTKAGTGALDHVALHASDFDGILARVTAMGLTHRVNHVQLELNFRGE